MNFLNLSLSFTLKITTTRKPVSPCTFCDNSNMSETASIQYMKYSKLDESEFMKLRGDPKEEVLPCEKCQKDSTKRARLKKQSARTFEVTAKVDIFGEPPKILVTQDRRNDLSKDVQVPEILHIDVNDSNNNQSNVSYKAKGLIMSVIVKECLNYFTIVREEKDAWGYCNENENQMHLTTGDLSSCISAMSLDQTSIRDVIVLYTLDDPGIFCYSNLYSHHPHHYHQLLTHLFLCRCLLYLSPYVCL